MLAETYSLTPTITRPKVSQKCRDSYTKWVIARVLAVATCKNPPMHPPFPWFSLHGIQVGGPCWRRLSKSHNARQKWAERWLVPNRMEHKRDFVMLLFCCCFLACRPMLRRPFPCVPAAASPPRVRTSLQRDLLFFCFVPGHWPWGLLHIHVLMRSRRQFRWKFAADWFETKHKVSLD
jgi:hypothetical protein